MGTFALVLPDRRISSCADDPSWICQQVLDATDGNEGLADFVNTAASILLIVIVTFVVTRIVHRYIGSLTRRIVAPEKTALTGRIAQSADKMLRGPEQAEAQQAAELRRSSRADSIGAVVGTTTNAIIWVISALLILGELGVNLGPLIAGAGLAGAALSFGAQHLIRDCISGLFVLVEDQYGIGDVIDLGEATGTVEEITLRATVVRGIDGTVWHVPNGEVQRVGNMSQLWSVALVDIDVAYDADIRSVGDMLVESAAALCATPEWEDQIIEEPKLLGVETLGADGVTLRVVVKTVPGAQWALQRAMREAFKASLDSAGIEIPFPQRTVWMRSEAT